MIARLVRTSILSVIAFVVLLAFFYISKSNDPLAAVAKQKRGFIPSAEDVFQQKPATAFVSSSVVVPQAEHSTPNIAFAKSAQDDAEDQDEEVVVPEGGGDDALVNEADILSASGESESDRAARYKRGEVDFYLLRQTRYYEDQPPAFPKELLALKDKKVKMLGFMSPYDDLNSMKNFMLMPMMTGCYFCVPPSIEEVLLIRQETDEHCPYIAEPVIIEGTLKLWDEKSDDPVYEMFLYIIEDAEVRVYDPVKDARKPVTQDHNNPH